MSEAPDDPLEAPEDTSERLMALDRALSEGATFTSEQQRFVDTVRTLVGLPASEGDEETPGDVVSRLLRAWRDGSRATADALNAAFQSEQSGNLEDARKILRLARERIGMPFYASILDAAIANLADER